MSEPESAPTDPLLDSDSYIDPGRSEPAAAAEPTEPTGHDADQTPEFAPGVVIAAEPISMYVPCESAAEATPKSVVRRKNPDERPTWLPEGWTIDLRVRTSGATAGHTDRYFVEPTGQRRFRSKVEVLHFLETGSKPKRKIDTEPSKSPASQKQRKANTKRKKADGVQPPQVDNGIHADNAQ